MKGKRFHHVCLVISAALAAILAVCTYYLGRNQTVSDYEELKSRLESIKASETNAAVVKRVSQQMEDIAYQQKEISDRQRLRAEEQSRLAIQMRDRAEQERKVAREAEEMAVLAAREAEEQRVNALIHQQTAEIQRDEATAAKSVTDTLSYRILGRTLGTSALSQYESGNKEIASMLAYTSWLFLDRYKGNTYLSECFNAMNTCAECAHTIEAGMSGSVRAIRKAKDNLYVAVSDYGEIELIWPDSLKSEGTLMHNPLYDFRDVYADTSHVYALSLHGALCVVDYHGVNLPTVLPSEESFFKIVNLNDHTLLLAGKNSIVWFDTKEKHIVGFVRLEQTLSDIVRCDGDQMLLLFANGECGQLLDRGKLASRGSLTKEKVTAAFYSTLSRRLYLGTATGLILMFDEQLRYISTLYGHSGAINDMTQIGDILVSNSYDKNTLVWNIPKVDEKLSESDVKSRQTSKTFVPKEWVTPASLNFDSWPMSVCPTGNGYVLIGLDNGRIVRTNVATEQVAILLQEKIKRNFTPEEWEYYISGTTPYTEIIKQ
ncbi:MAG: hypothetical protein Q4E55_00335 [Bacteroidales bacterium]|nr:hypothetical protein [Bacteroidales bacterium]